MNNLLMLFILVPILALVLLFLNFLFSAHRPDESKISAYECGYSAIRKQNRTDFQIQFYVVAMLFLIFDLEILLLFPIAVTLYKLNKKLIKLNNIKKCYILLKGKKKNKN